SIPTSCIAALSGSAAALVGLGRLETSDPCRTCGFRDQRWSAVPTALHRGLTRMSYFRDGHREPADPQPTSSSTGDKPLRLSVDIHFIRHHTVRLADSFARRRGLVVLHLRIGRSPADGYSARHGRRTPPVLHPALSPHSDPGRPERKARAGVQLRPWRRGLISGGAPAPGF